MASSSVASQPAAAAASMMARVDRLDLVVGYLEGMRGAASSGRRSSSPSTATATTVSDDCGSSAASTPRAAGSCRPAKEALQEARAKGSLVDRIAFLENRVLKMEEEMEVTSDLRSSSGGGGGGGEKRRRRGKADKGKRLKSLVKSCVRGKLNTND